MEGGGTKREASGILELTVLMEDDLENWKYLWKSWVESWVAVWQQRQHLVLCSTCTDVRCSDSRNFPEMSQWLVTALRTVRQYDHQNDPLLL